MTSIRSTRTSSSTHWWAWKTSLMRRLLPSALLALCCTMPCLCASMYSSNAMMQRLDAITAIPETGYFIVEDGDESILYLDGEEVRRVVQRADEVVTSDDNGVNVVRLQGGRPIGETTSDGIDISYEYAENGTLYRAVYSKDNQILRVVQYLVTPSPTGQRTVYRPHPVSMFRHSMTKTPHFPSQMRYDSTTVRVC